MSKRYPNIDTDNFPNIGNVDVWKRKTVFDYSLYDDTQMTITVCVVPWDLGEIHVGIRTIEKLGNVVKFENDDARDAWIKAIPDNEKYVWETKFRKFHDVGEIQIPLSIEESSMYNYIVIEYEPLPDDEIGQEFKSSDGIMRWFYFIRELSMIGATSTKAVCKRDTWQTIINRIDIPYMLVEQGHVGIQKSDVNKFLANPVDNNSMLLAPDLNYGEPEQVTYQNATVLNDENVYACIAMTANPRGAWGTEYATSGWRVPASSAINNQGVPSVHILAMLPENLNTFLTAVDADIPQFKQAVKGVFFASTKLITLGTEYTLAGVSCFTVTATQKTLDFLTLNKSMFGFDSRYSDLAKLYTFPYSKLEITDETGNVTEIRVENVGTKLELQTSLSLAFPYLNIDAFISGVGKTGTSTLSFKNITSRNFKYGGKWYDTLHSWEIPIFEVIQQASTVYDFDTHFEREQKKVAYTNGYDSSIASNATSKTNADASATTSYDNSMASNATNKSNADAEADTTYTNDVNNNNATYNNSVDSANTAYSNDTANAATAYNNSVASAQANKTNADRSADNDIANTAIQTAANSAINSTSNAASSSDTSLSNALNQGIQAWNAGYTRDTTNNEVEAQYASAAVGAAAGVIGSVASGAMSGGLVGAAAGLVTGAISGASSMAQTAVAANLLSTQAEATISNSQNQVTATNNNNVTRNSVQIGANTDNVNTNNDAMTGVNANNSATAKSNATTSQNTENANATRSQSTANANAGRTQSTDTSNASRSRTTSNDNALRAQTTSKANNTRTKNTADSNAARTQTTDKANNTRTKTTSDANAVRTRDTAIQDVSNSIRQAALKAPDEYGSFANGETATTRPQAMFVNVVTQPDSCIEQAGDNFLRFGYALNKYIEFEGFNVMPHFSFWKCSDISVKGLSIPDVYMDEIRFFLLGGVTVWRNPEDIGRISIYENK